MVCMLYFYFQSAQVEYWGQTRHTKILESKTIIDTYSCIQHGLDSFELKREIFFLHNSCSILIKQVINVKEVRRLELDI